MPLSSIASFEKSNCVSNDVYQLENGYMVTMFYRKNKSCFQLLMKRDNSRHTLFCESYAPLEIQMPVSSPTVEFQIVKKLNEFREAIDFRSVDASKLSSNAKEIKREYPCCFGAILVDESCWFFHAFSHIRKYFICPTMYLLVSNVFVLSEK